MKSLLPIALDLENVPVLVVGGGNISARKVGALLEAKARVTVVSPDLRPDFPLGIEHLKRGFQNGDCNGFKLVFAATNLREVNIQVVREAKNRGIWVNDASNPAESDFHTSKTVRRGPICVGVTTSGVSPVLAKHVASQIESVIGPEYARLFEILNEIGPLHLGTRRGEFWTQLLESVLSNLRAGDETAARATIARLLAEN